MLSVSDDINVVLFHLCWTKRARNMPLIEVISEVFFKFNRFLKSYVIWQLVRKLVHSLFDDDNLGPIQLLWRKIVTEMKKSTNILSTIDYWFVYVVLEPILLFFPWQKKYANALMFWILSKSFHNVQKVPKIALFRRVPSYKALKYFISRKNFFAKFLAKPAYRKLSLLTL